MDNKLKILKKYVEFIEHNNYTWLYLTCILCKDSELSLQVGVDESDDPYLFCLMPKCSYKYYPGFDKIITMRNKMILEGFATRKELSN